MRFSRVSGVLLASCLATAADNVAAQVTHAVGGALLLRSPELTAEPDHAPRASLQKALPLRSPELTAEPNSAPRASLQKALPLRSPELTAEPNNAPRASLRKALPLRSPELTAEPEHAPRASLQNRILTGLGGALLGAGAGFFASQVLIGDWEDTSARERVGRPAWAAIGGSVGFALGFSFPLSTKPGGPPVRVEQPHPRITSAEIQRTSASNAYEAVSALRPQWLIQRGTDVIGETPAETIRVYLDGNELGGIATLTLVSATTIASIEFLDAAAASLRWGAGHSHGAILIIGN